jgi:uncharacterized phage protein (TIGR02220 family)
MARIRTIKPDFWTSEQIAELSPIARLLFIGMWNFCDDGGNHPASAKSLKMQIFPGDDFTVATVAEWIKELLNNGLIVEYQGNDGKAYWHVTGWHHQKIDRPHLKHPKFDERSTIIRRNDGDQSPPEGNGREGKGMDIETTSLVGQDPTPPADPLQNPKPERFATETAQVIEYLNATTGRQFKGSKSDRATIAARFKEKYNLEDFKAIVDHKTAAWLHDPKQSEYLRPETLFSAKHFDSYLNAAKIPSATLKPVNGTTTTTTYTPPDPNRRKAGSW